MRVFALFLMITTFVFSQDLPEIFSSAGDDIYKSMSKYRKIKDLDIYRDRPEFLESFCADANTSIQKGYALDRIQRDPEASIDKVLIKSYAKELRRLANQNEAIEHQLREDIRKLYEANDFNSLLVFRSAGIELNQEMIEAIKAYEKKKEQEKSSAAVVAKSKEKSKKKPKPENTSKTKEQKSTTLVKREKSSKPAVVVKAVSMNPAEAKTMTPSIAVPVVESPKQKPKAAAVKMPQPSKVEARQEVAVVKMPHSDIKAAPSVVEEKKVLTKLEYYEQNLIRLKEELYELRDSGDNEKVGCLNDITAINYWMIDLLKNERDACATRDAIKQMKSYDKSSVNSCGRDSLRYMEWHGRIKPYVGRKLFQAEAACNR